jgi:hypothetical protein
MALSAVSCVQRLDAVASAVKKGQLIVALIGAGLVLAYAFLACVAQTIPETPVFNGWIMVLTPADNASTKVGIDIRTLEPGAPGGTPSISLDVVACGGSRPGAPSSPRCSAAGSPRPPAASARQPGRP